MPDWKRIVVGDAFQLSSRDFNYYRDLLLAWPFFLFTIAGLADVFRGGDYRIAYRCLALSIVALLLARERLFLIGGGLGFCAVQSGISFVLKHDLKALAVSASTGVLFGLLIYRFKDYKPSYSWPKDTHIVDILVGLASLGLALAMFSWIRR